jgi:hypothetical protein
MVSEYLDAKAALAAAVAKEREACALVAESFITTYVLNGERWLKGENGEPDVRIKDLVPHLHGSVVARITVAHKILAAIRARADQGEKS